jgi:hypothetical protein
LYQLELGHRLAELLAFSRIVQRFVEQALARLRMVPASAPRDLLEAWAHSMTARTA